MKGTECFSKLTLKWGYHQIELEHESKTFTTFVTHNGLWRDKRLMLFSLSSGRIMYQHVIQQVLQGIDWLKNLR